MSRARINKEKIIGYFNWLRIAIIRSENFTNQTGTAQLGAKTAREKEMVRRAVAYGRAEAMEQMVRMVGESDDLIVNFDVEKGLPTYGRGSN